ncbi:MAG: hypothetical protein K1X53_12470 [Candidatus Sumerlaeaceae bacterium]|nr:hypothetical protein [Candidatus Sumerlaeaceae bacterium]
MNRRFQWPAFRTIAPDLVAFGIGLGMAWFFHWKTTDLVWSLWLGSLVLGYLTILSTIAGGVYIGITVLLRGEMSARARLGLGALGATVALFFLGFFSLHFCGFHAGHAGFLSHFFPLDGVPPTAFFEGFMNPFVLWKAAIQYVVPLYGLFLIPVVIAERRNVFDSILEARRAMKQFPENAKVDQLAQDRIGRAKTTKDAFSRPYVNVIRMHLLIFFFAFCQMLKVESFFVYAVVYFVYFFPWRAFREDPQDAVAEESKAGLERKDKSQEAAGDREL